MVLPKMLFVFLFFFKFFVQFSNSYVSTNHRTCGKFMRYLLGFFANFLELKLFTIVSQISLLKLSENTANSFRKLLIMVCWLKLRLTKCSRVLPAQPTGENKLIDFIHCSRTSTSSVHILYSSYSFC
jgi:hypothetical protein